MKEKEKEGIRMKLSWPGGGIQGLWSGRADGGEGEGDGMDEMW